MATLREAINFGRLNPTDGRSVQLMNDIKSGKFDDIARAEGIDLTGKSETFNPKPEQSILSKASEQGGELSKQFVGSLIVKPLLGLGEIGEKFLENTAGRVVDPLANSLRDFMGKTRLTEKDFANKRKESVFNRDNEINKLIREVATPTTPAGEAGSFLGEVASYAIPSSGALKATAGVGKMGTLITQAVTSGAVATAQSGEIGKDTALATGTELIFPVIGKVFGIANRYGIQEGIGRLSGTSQETLQEAFGAAVKGGKSREAFVKALRSEITPEEIVNALNQNKNALIQRRGADYAKSIAEIGGESVDTSTLRTDFLARLNEFKITQADDGTLDFSASNLRTVPQAQAKITQTLGEIQSISGKGTTNIVDIDTTRQAINNIALTGEDRSANIANSLISYAENLVRERGTTVSGYKQMLESFAEDSEFLESLTKDLLANDKRTIDQTFRRMVTSLRTNNEQRMTLVKNLDEMTDGFITAKISGQQLSEPLSRGLIGTIMAGSLGGALVTGSGGTVLGVAPLLVLSSPRVIGEVINALALSKIKSEALIDAFIETQKVLAEILGVRPEDIVKTLITKEK